MIALLTDIVHITHSKKTWEKVAALALARCSLRCSLHCCFCTPRDVRLLVHGSLARAGKVKSQTPKVEKQEKKKTPKGRAKKRMVYNRRCVLTAAFGESGWGIDCLCSFVNVTTLPGGKRRM